MNAVVKPVVMAAPALTFRAWTIAADNSPRFEAHPAGEWSDAGSADEVAASLANALTHMGSIVVLRSDSAERPERRHLVHLYSVKKRTRPIGWEYPNGRAVAIYKYYAERVTQFCVHEGFEPVRPWRIEDGNPVGRDLTLVDG